MRVSTIADADPDSDSSHHLGISLDYSRYHQKLPLVGGSPWIFLLQH
jgi:hypothetical protein